MPEASDIGNRDVEAGHREGAGEEKAVKPKDKRAAIAARRLRPLAVAMDEGRVKPIFRRFGSLTTLNLLILQEELVQLKTEFEKLPSTQTGPAKETLYLGMPPPGNEGQVSLEEQARAKLLLRLRATLKEYNSALLDASNLWRLDPPEHSDANYLRRWLTPEIGGQVLENDDGNYRDANNEKDFVSLQSQARKDNRIILKIKMFFHVIYWKLKGYGEESTDPRNPTIIHLGKNHNHESIAKRERRKAFTSRLFMALFGGIALIIPTVIMAKHQGINYSLVTTAISTVLFAFILAFGATDSTGKDVLGATAAYAAVLVVFIGTSVSKSH